MWQHFPKPLRRTFLRHQRLILGVSIVLFIEWIYHINSYNVRRPAKSLDEPFYVGCQEPNTEARRENATIIMLARNSEVNGAVRAIQSLESQFNRWFHYPIIFLNDKPWDQYFIKSLTSVASGEVRFEVIDELGLWGYPDWIDQDNARRCMKSQEARGILYAGMESYHHMCRFNSGTFFDHRALKPYKWYWRVDPDVEFTCAITYDPFVAMAKSGKKYGYTLALWELGQSVPSLFRKFSEYKRAKKIPSTSLWNAMVDASWAPLPIRPFLRFLTGRDSKGDTWNFCHFWSNFEIADMDWYRGKAYRELFEYLDRDGGFYYERWGDAPVHSLAAALLLRPEEVHYFADFGYVHEPFQACPFNAPGRQLPNSPTLGSNPWDPETEAAAVGCRCECPRTPRKRLVSPVCMDTLRMPVDHVHKPVIGA